jgi:hypothetical protein
MAVVSGTDGMPVEGESVGGNPVDSTAPVPEPDPWDCTTATATARKRSVAGAARADM